MFTAKRRLPPPPVVRATPIGAPKSAEQAGKDQLAFGRTSVRLEGLFHHVNGDEARDEAAKRALDGAKTAFIAGFFALAGCLTCVGAALARDRTRLQEGRGLVAKREKAKEPMDVPLPTFDHSASIMDIRSYLSILRQWTESGQPRSASGALIGDRSTQKPANREGEASWDSLKVEPRVTGAAWSSKSADKGLIDPNPVHPVRARGQQSLPPAVGPSKPLQPLPKAPSSRPEAGQKHDATRSSPTSVRSSAGPSSGSPPTAASRTATGDVDSNRRLPIEDGSIDVGSATSRSESLPPRSRAGSATQPRSLPVSTVALGTASPPAKKAPKKRQPPSPDVLAAKRTRIAIAGAQKSPSSKVARLKGGNVEGLRSHGHSAGKEDRWDLEKTYNSKGRTVENSVTPHRREPYRPAQACENGPKFPQPVINGPPGGLKPQPKRNDQGSGRTPPLPKPSTGKSSRLPRAVPVQAAKGSAVRAPHQAPSPKPTPNGSQGFGNLSSKSGPGSVNAGPLSCDSHVSVVARACTETESTKKRHASTLAPPPEKRHKTVAPTDAVPKKALKPSVSTAARSLSRSTPHTKEHSDVTLRGTPAPAPPAAKELPTDHARRSPAKAMAAKVEPTVRTPSKSSKPNQAPQPKVSDQIFRELGYLSSKVAASVGAGRPGDGNNQGKDQLPVRKPDRAVPLEPPTKSSISPTNVTGSTPAKSAISVAPSVSPANEADDELWVDDDEVPARPSENQGQTKRRKPLRPKPRQSSHEVFRPKPVKVGTEKPAIGTPDQPPKANHAPPQAKASGQIFRELGFFPAKSADVGRPLDTGGQPKLARRGPAAVQKADRADPSEAPKTPAISAKAYSGSSRGKSTSGIAPTLPEAKESDDEWEDEHEEGQEAPVPRAPRSEKKKGAKKREPKEKSQEPPLARDQIVEEALAFLEELREENEKNPESKLNEEDLKRAEPLARYFRLCLEKKLKDKKSDRYFIKMLLEPGMVEALILAHGPAVILAMATGNLDGLKFADKAAKIRTTYLIRVKKGLRKKKTIDGKLLDLILYLYIGLTDDLKRRLRQHRGKTNSKLHPSMKLYQTPKPFEIEVAELLPMPAHIADKYHRDTLRVLKRMTEATAITVFGHIPDEPYKEAAQECGLAVQSELLGKGHRSLNSRDELDSNQWYWGRKYVKACAGAARKLPIVGHDWMPVSGLCSHVQATFRLPHAMSNKTRLMTLPKHDVDAAIKQYDNNAAFRTEVRKLVHNGKKLNDARHKTFITVAQPHVFVSFAPKCSYNSFFAPYELSHHLRQFNRKERDILQRFEMIMAYADPRGSKEPVVRFCTVTERKCPGANPARTAKLVLELYDFIKKRWIISLAEDFIPMETAAYET